VTVTLCGAEQVDAHKNNSEPENQHDQEGRGDRTPRLLEQQPAHLADIEREAERLALEGALGIVLW
jgi:hypothetical protein